MNYFEHNAKQVEAPKPVNHDYPFHVALDTSGIDVQKQIELAILANKRA